MNFSHSLINYVNIAASTLILSVWIEVPGILSERKGWAKAIGQHVDNLCGTITAVISLLNLERQSLS